MLSKSRADSGYIIHGGPFHGSVISLERRHMDVQGNTFAFGVLLLELISGRPPFCKDRGCLVDWVSDMYQIFLKKNHQINFKPCWNYHPMKCFHVLFSCRRLVSWQCTTWWISIMEWKFSLRSILAILHVFCPRIAEFIEFCTVKTSLFEINQWDWWYYFSYKIVQNRDTLNMRWPWMGTWWF